MVSTIIRFDSQLITVNTFMIKNTDREIIMYNVFEEIIFVSI